MSNRFSCNFSGDGDFHEVWPLLESYLGYVRVVVDAYYFFYCAQPNATSASIQNVKTNLLEYHVNRLKIDYCDFRPADNPVSTYVMFFVLCVPQDYVPSKSAYYFKLSELPSHTIPENVLYYDFVTYDRVATGVTKNISIDIKKSFRVSPSYKLAFVTYSYGIYGSPKKEGTAQVFFAVN